VVEELNTADREIITKLDYTTHTVALQIPPKRNDLAQAEYTGHQSGQAWDIGDDAVSAQ
jgi:hypothetical protein